MITKHWAEPEGPERRCDWCAAPIIEGERFWCDQDTASVGCCQACAADAASEVERALSRREVRPS